nr:lysophospholipid acyltransferase family protein [Nocardioides piscis]
MRDLTYPPVILTAKTAFRLLGQRFRMVGTEHVPRTGGVLLAFNHIGYVDFVYGGLAANPSGRLVRFMAKREIFDNRFAGPLMRSLHHIEVDRSAGDRSLAVALDHLKAGEAVGIFPKPPSRGRWS